MLHELRTAFTPLFRPFELLGAYRRSYLQPDLLAGLTVAILLLPQAIAYALIAELPAETGLYTAIVAAIVGGLWGSSHHLQTGPTNATSLLVLSVLLPVAQPGTREFLVAAGLLTLMVGVIRMLLGLAHLGVLVNFVSDSVVIGFTAGAAVLIAIGQVRHLLGLPIPGSPDLLSTLQGIAFNLDALHWLTLAIGAGVIALIVLLMAFAPNLPAPLIAMAAATALVAVLQLDQVGVRTIGELPRSLPPLAALPIFDLELIGQLSTGALAVGALGLVEAMSSARAISAQSGQRLDSNQEFVGQGLANLASGFFSGYTCSGSPSRSVVNYRAGAQTSLSSVFTGLFVLAAMLALAPVGAYLPRAALAGVLIVTAFRMVDRREVVRIWRGARGDALILLMTLAGTLFLPLHFAVLAGILASFAVYIMRTSVPRVISVLPDASFRHLMPHSDKEPCPQMAIIDVLGDLYFGAVNHVEKAVLNQLNRNPGQRFLLLRMRSVHNLDISGVHVLESILRSVRERGGDLYMMWVRPAVLERLQLTGFYDRLGADHFFEDEAAISHLFYRVIDPAVCIYECPVRAFKECQNLPKRSLPGDVEFHTELAPGKVQTISARELWAALHSTQPPRVIDVREPREFRRSHIQQAELLPLPRLLQERPAFQDSRPLVFVCRGGRRSLRAAALFAQNGHPNSRALEGGMLAWETEGLLTAVEYLEDDDEREPVT